jgi:hypothetical protein
MGERLRGGLTRGSGRSTHSDHIHIHSVELADSVRSAAFDLANALENLSTTTVAITLSLQQIREVMAELGLIEGYWEYEVIYPGEPK